MKGLIKISTLLFMVSLIFCNQAMGVFAHDGYYHSMTTCTSSDGKYEYRILNGKYAEIEANDEYIDPYESGSVYYIPSEIDGYIVQSIGSYAFAHWEGSSKIKKIVIPDTVTHIADRAFIQTTREFRGGSDDFETSNFEEFVIPSSVVYIGDEAFYGNDLVKHFEIPESVIYIGNEAFARCYSLKEVEIPGTVKYLGDEIFSGCKNLEKVTIQQGVPEINKKTFYNCPKLKNVTAYTTTIFCDKSLGYLYDEKKKKETINKKIKINIIEENDYINTLFSSEISECGVFYLLKNNKHKLRAFPAATIKLKVKGEKVLGWSSSNKKVAVIKNNGKMTALAKGTTTITAKLADGTKYSRKVKVRWSPKLNWVKINDKGEKVLLGDAIKITLKKGETKELCITHKVDSIKNIYTNTKIAKFIGNGKSEYFKVKALKKGSTTLKVKVNGVKTLKLKVKVI